MSDRRTSAERAYGVPTIKDLANDLHVEGAYLRVAFAPGDLRDDNSDSEGADVRLQIHDGCWTLHSGDSSYDQDHRGVWGASSIERAATWKQARETAKDLIDQALEEAYSNGDLSTEPYVIPEKASDCDACKGDGTIGVPTTATGDRHDRQVIDCDACNGTGVKATP